MCLSIFYVIFYGTLPELDQFCCLFSGIPEDKKNVLLRFSDLFFNLTPLFSGVKNELNLIIREHKSCTANVCRELQGLYREIGQQGFQIYGDFCYHPTAVPGHCSF